MGDVMVERRQTYNNEKEGVATDTSDVYSIMLYSVIADVLQDEGNKTIQK
jgi:hypothetical protein